MKNFCLSTALIMLVLIAPNAHAQFEYSYPMDGSKNELPFTHMILRNGQLMDPNALSSDLVTLTGSISGDVPASVVLASDGKTVCITPAHNFAYGEQVTMKVKDGLTTQSGQILSGITIHYSIRRQVTAQEKAQLKAYLATHDASGDLIEPRPATYVGAPLANDTRGQSFKFINIYTNNSGAAPGEIFFHRNTGNTELIGRGYGIMENNGDSVFFRGDNDYDGANFQVNLNGQLTAYRLNYGVDTTTLVLDSSYNIVGSVGCLNGLHASQHDQLFMPDGTKWFTIYDWQPGWDLSSYGGSSSSFVNVSWIQELDATNQNVIFSWRSDQHFQISDAASDIQTSIASGYYDPWHVNTITIDDDGNMIAGFRNMDMVVKIKPTNGQVVWYWGDNTNYFPLILTLNDPNGGFSHPHHIRRIEPGLTGAGHIMMMDNGNNHVPPVSQAKEYVLDETNFTATEVWTYTHPQINGFNLFTKQQGSVFRLPNGNTIIGYGLPTIAGLYNGTEIDANKNIVWEFRFKDSTEYSYRIYKTVWNPNVGVASVQRPTALQVFPNPAQGMVTLKLGETSASTMMVEVINVLGEKVYSRQLPARSGDVPLDLSALDKGMYLIQVTQGEQKSVGRLVID